MENRLWSHTMDVTVEGSSRSVQLCQTSMALLAGAMGICSAAGVGSGVGQYAEHIWEIRSEQNQKELLGVWVSALR